MQFAAVAGQQALKRNWISMVESGSLPHALLLSGKEGTGGLPLAIAFAQYLFCEKKTVSDSCGQCPSCRKIAKLAHPDLHFSFPAVAPKPGVKPLSRHFMESFREFFLQSPYGSTYDWLQFIKAENKQGNIPAEECREIIERLSFKSFEGGYKVQIIWRPEYLGREGNILLKLIEEPPADTLILLVAEEPEDIIATILSRTQLLQLVPLSTTEITEALMSGNQIDIQKASQIAHLSDGSYTQALQLMRNHSSDLLTPLREWVQAVFNNNLIAVHHWVEDMAKQGREQQKNSLVYLQQLLAHAIRMILIPGYQPALPEDELAFLRSFCAKGISPKTCELFIKSIAKAVYHIERNAHSKTQLMQLSVQMQYHLKERELKAFPS